MHRNASQLHIQISLPIPQDCVSLIDYLMELERYCNASLCTES